MAYIEPGSPMVFSDAKATFCPGNEDVVPTQQKSDAHLIHEHSLYESGGNQIAKHDYDRSNRQPEVQRVTADTGLLIQRALAKNPGGTRSEEEMGEALASAHAVNIGEYLMDLVTRLWYICIGIPSANLLYLRREDNDGAFKYTVDAGTLHGIANVVDAAQLQQVIGGIGNPGDLEPLFQDGGTGAQLLTLFQNENNGATLHNLIQAVNGHNIAHLIQLYGDGANSVQINTLLGHETNGATLHNLIQAVSGHNIAHLIQLYGDGANSVQINTLLGHETNGATLHNLIQGINGNNIAHLIQLYGDGANSVQINTLLGHETNGATLHNLIQTVNGHNIAHLIQLYGDGANSVQINTLLGHETNGATLHNLIQGINGNNIAHLIQLYGDGANSVQIKTLIGIENRGDILHNLIQTTQNNDVDHLIRLYKDGPTKTLMGALVGGACGGLTGAVAGAILGTTVLPGLGSFIGGILGAIGLGLIGAGIGALIGRFTRRKLTTAQVQGLLAHETDGNILHALLRRIKGSNADHLIRLYNDGATSVQIQAALAHEKNGETLHTYMPIILRQNAGGLPINAAMIRRIKRQIGTVGKIEELEAAGGGDNLQWSQQHANLQNTEFGRWLLAGGQKPSARTGNMNCWEVVFFGAYKKGYISKQWLVNFYQQFVNDIAANNFTTIENAIRIGNNYVYNPAVLGGPRPQRGDIVTFQQAVAHTAIAIGNAAGSPQVLSLWNTPNASLHLQQTDVATLLASGANQPVNFFSPDWG